MAILNILFCDDNTQFAFNQVETICRKLKTKYGVGSASVSVETITHLKPIHDLIANPPILEKYDLIFCDLGWSDLTLNGIQLLHDIQMANPRIYTVLYTAQDEDAIISQALKWQLDFIDTVIKIDGNDYFNEMLEVIRNRFRRKVVEIVGGAEVEMIRKRLAMYLNPKLPDKIPDDKPVIAGYDFYDLFPGCHQLITGRDKLPAGQAEKIRKQIEELIDELSSASTVKLGDRYLSRLIEVLDQFPRVENSDLLAIKKSSYIEFIKKKYGGFPQMAKERGLDLNNIYRVNRRFKGAPFVVFQYDTIREIVGIYDKADSDRTIAEMLAAKELKYLPS